MLRLSLILSLFAASPASAATPSCRTIAAAAEVGRDDQAVLWAAPIAAAVLAAEARLDLGTAAPRVAFVDLAGGTGAWFCRGADTVFVARSLLRYAHLGRASDGGDFLAFVIGHELAHRRFDLAPASAGAASFHAGDAPDLEREAAADERAAFLVALARDPASHRGFSPWKLARDGTLAHYLADEAGVDAGAPAHLRRVDALRAALAHMGELAEAYEVALALAFAPFGAAADGLGLGPRDLADELLTGLDAALNAPAAWARVPELSLVRALLHAERAAGGRGVRCRVSYAGHVAMSPFDALGARSPDGTDVAREIAAGRRALAEAASRQLPAALTAPIAACLDRVAAATGTAPSVATRVAPPDGTGSDLVIERLAFAAEQACELEPRTARVIALAAGPVITAGAVGGARCYRSGPQGGVRVAFLAPRDPEAADLATWVGACEVFGRGVGDDGSEAFGAYCASVDAGRMRGWTLFARGERVERVVRVLLQ